MSFISEAARRAEEEEDGEGPRSAAGPDAGLGGAGDCEYQLMGVVEHLGGAAGGHFVAFRRLGAAGEPGGGVGGVGGRKGGGEGGAPAQWTRCSDADVRAVPLAEVLAAEAYMLLYARVR